MHSQCVYIDILTPSSMELERSREGELESGIGRLRLAINSRVKRDKRGGSNGQVTMPIRHLDNCLIQRYILEK